jgi:hypothetical protein
MKQRQRVPSGIDIHWSVIVSLALDKEFVVGEMQFGDRHTTEPEMWIRRFREKDYKMLSVVLKVCFDACVSICREEMPDAINQYNLFCQKYQNIFAHKTKVKEICVNNENKSHQK